MLHNPKKINARVFKISFFATTAVLSVILVILISSELYNLDKAKNDLRRIAYNIHHIQILSKAQGRVWLPNKGVVPLLRKFADCSIQDPKYFVLDPWNNKVQIDYSKKTVFLEGWWPDFWARFGITFEESFTSSRVWKKTDGFLINEVK